MNNREEALTFVRRFAAGDVDGLIELLSEDLRVVGPYLRVTSRAAYIEALRRDPPLPYPVRILSVEDDADTVTVSYAYHKSDGELRVDQTFRFVDGRIGEMRVVFDTEEPA